MPGDLGVWDLRDSFFLLSFFLSFLLGVKLGMD